MGRAMNLTNRRIATWCMLQHNKERVNYLKSSNRWKTKEKQMLKWHLMAWDMEGFAIRDKKKKKKKQNH